MNNGFATTNPTALWNEDGVHEGVLLVDVRTPAEFQETHIPGSFNAPLGDLNTLGESVRKQGFGRRVVLVCRTGRRAESALERLRQMGVENLEVAAGGVSAWKNAGLPLNHGEKAAVSLERQVRIAAGLLVVIGVLLGFVLHPGFFGLSAFVGAGLAIAGITDTCGMGMVLARMPWNRASVCCDKG